MSKKKAPTGQDYGVVIGMKITIGRDTWRVVQEEDALAIGGRDRAFGGDGDKVAEVVIVDPGTRRIVVGECFEHPALIAAITHAIAISAGTLTD